VCPGIAAGLVAVGIVIACSIGSTATILSMLSSRPVATRRPALRDACPGSGVRPRETVLLVYASRGSFCETGGSGRVASAAFGLAPTRRKRRLDVHG